MSVSTREILVRVARRRDPLRRRARRSQRSAPRPNRLQRVNRNAAATNARPVTVPTADDGRADGGSVNGGGERQHPTYVPQMCMCTNDEKWLDKLLEEVVLNMPPDVAALFMPDMSELDEAFREVFIGNTTERE